MKRGGRGQRTGDHASLRRLLDRDDAAFLIASASAGRPSASVAVVEADGTPYLGDDWVLPLGSRIRRAIAEATTSPVPIGPSMRLHVLRTHDRVVGGVLVGGLEIATGDLLGGAFQLVLDRAVDARDLGQETLDRYREINVLYRLGDTIGASLDAGEIPQMMLSEALHAIRADTAAALLACTDGTQLAAEVGLPAAVRAMVDVSRDVVAAAIASGQPATVSVALGESGVGTLLCAPIRSHERPLGALVVARASDQPPFSAGDEKLLLAVATEGGVAYDRARLHDERVRRERQDEELSIGRRIQHSLLPERLPQHPGWDFAAVYRAARQVGGDFYDFIPAPDDAGTMQIVIGDVTGKGVPAALLMASTRATIRATSSVSSSPADMLRRTNAHLVQDGRSGLFVTALAGTLSLGTGRFTFASGGHDPPVWLHAAGRRARLVASRSSILGLFADVELEDRAITLQPGDALVLYTDGVTEARDRRGALFGERRMMRAARTHARENAMAIADGVTRAVEAFVGDVQASDDMTLVVIRRR